MSKLCAIMFTDIKEYSTLAAKNASKASRITELNSTLQNRLISEFHGTILEKKDDNILACFENGIDAVSCAMAIQESLTDIPEYELRIGVHLGEFDEKLGIENSTDIQIVKKIETLSAPSGICITGVLYDEIEKDLEIKTMYLGKQRLIRGHKKSKIHAITGHGLHIPALDNIHISPDEIPYLKTLLTPLNVFLLIIILLSILAVLALKP